MSYRDILLKYQYLYHDKKYWDSSMHRCKCIVAALEIGHVCKIEGVKLKRRSLHFSLEYLPLCQVLQADPACHR